ncbi:MAG: SIMPL domain-containing protein [Actinobacteria bacterium]|nr:SIMPL domain-containing protein [Actinomycetota bacterium]
MIKRLFVSAISLSLLSGVVLAPASSAATPVKRYLNVSAEGTVKVVPDAVRINATATSLLPTTKAALASTAKAAAAMRAAFLANGVATKDIATQSVTVNPEYNYVQDSGQILLGYRASQNFTVIVRKARTAGAITDAIVEAGGDNVLLNGVTPFVLNTTKAVVGARAAAVKNAQAKARAYASLAGLKLGKINYLVENSSPVSYPVMQTVTKDSAPSTQIDLGQQDVTVTISIQWGLL